MEPRRLTLDPYGGLERLKLRMVGVRNKAGEKIIHVYRNPKFGYKCFHQLELRYSVTCKLKHPDMIRIQQLLFHGRSEIYLSENG